MMKSSKSGGHTSKVEITNISTRGVLIAGVESGVFFAARGVSVVSRGPTDVPRRQRAAVHPFALDQKLAAHAWNAALVVVDQ